MLASCRAEGIDGEGARGGGGSLGRRRGDNVSDRKKEMPEQVQKVEEGDLVPNN